MVNIDNCVASPTQLAWPTLGNPVRKPISTDGDPLCLHRGLLLYPWA